jgi:serine/threonine protein kinase
MPLVRVWCSSNLRCSQLGHGAFGAVFVGTHKFANSGHVRSVSFEPEWSKVAIKKTTPNALDLRGGRVINTYNDLQERCQEIKTLLRLKEGSPTTSNVLYMYEFFMSGKDFYMVTELLGQELDDWRQTCDVFTEKMAIDICRTILQSLAFCASRRVVHRDVKLQNILFRLNGNFRTLKLVDFGLACALEENQSVRDFCGSIGYIAPEIYTGKSYRYEVDMFAFGVLLFRLLSGERPFPSNNSQILKRHTIELRYNVQGEDWESVSSSAKDLVRKLLINRQERLTAERALRHKWFSEIGESVLRPDRSTTRSHQDASRSRAVVLVSTTIRQAATATNLIHLTYVFYL